MHMHARGRVLLIWMLGILVSICAGCHSDAPHPARPTTAQIDVWYLMSTGGESIGWMHEIQTETDEGFETERSMDMKMSVSETEYRMQLCDTFIEDQDGTPIRSTSVAVILGETMTTDIDFTGSEVVQTVTTSEDTQVTSHEQTDTTWFMPAAMDRYVHEHMSAGEHNIAFMGLLSASDVEPREFSWSFIGQQTIDLLGEVTIVRVWSVATEGQPDSIQFWSTNGDLLYEETGMGISSVEVTLVARDVALAALEGGGAETSLFLILAALDKAIPDVEETRSVTFRVSTKGSIPLPKLPEAGAQRIVQSDSNSIVTSFSPRSPVPALEIEKTDPSYLRSTSLLDFDDESIGELIKAAAPSGSSQYDVAEELRMFVYRYIEDKTLSGGYDSASQIASNRSGDCTEHAVLLAALLRGYEIPARIAFGLSYVADETDGWFVLWPHAWTQALIDGFWIDLDAIEPQRIPHAARILASFDDVERPINGESGISLTSLESNTALLALTNMLIEVLNVEY